MLLFSHFFDMVKYLLFIFNEFVPILQLSIQSFIILLQTSLKPLLQNLLTLQPIKPIIMIPTYTSDNLLATVLHNILQTILNNLLNNFGINLTSTLVRQYDIKFGYKFDL